MRERDEMIGLDAEFDEENRSQSDRRIHEKQHPSNIDIPGQVVDLRKSAQTLFVNNIPEGISEDELLKLFEKYGDVDNVVIPKMVNGKRAKYGIVEMPVEGQAADALDKLNGFDLGGSRLTVTPAQTHQDFHFSTE